MPEETTPQAWSSLSKNSTNGRTLYRLLLPVRLLCRVLNPVAPGLAARIGLLLFRSTHRYALPRREEEWLDRATPVKLRLDGRGIAGWSWGEGPTVLLMHGWHGRASQMGAFAAPLVEAGFRVVALDAPGHGASDGKLSSLPQFAGVVRLAAERFGPLRAVIAHSFGAAGTGWALHGGLAAERLVFVAAPGDLHGYMGLFQELVGLSDRSLARMLAELERRFGVDWQEARYATTVAADATPMLVVHDAGDDETPIAGGRFIASAWPNGRLLETTGLGHRRILRDPEVIERVVEFLSMPARATAARPGRTGLAGAISSRRTRRGSVA